MNATHFFLPSLWQPMDFLFLFYVPSQSFGDARSRKKKGENNSHIISILHNIQGAKNKFLLGEHLSKCLEIYALLNFKLLRQADEKTVKFFFFKFPIKPKVSIKTKS